MYNITIIIVNISNYMHRQLWLFKSVCKYTCGGDQRGGQENNTVATAAAVLIFVLFANNFVVGITLPPPSSLTFPSIIDDRKPMISSEIAFIQQNY